MNKNTGYLFILASYVLLLIYCVNIDERLQALHYQYDMSKYHIRSLERIAVYHNKNIWSHKHKLFSGEPKKAK